MEEENSKCSSKFNLFTGDEGRNSLPYLTHKTTGLSPKLEELNQRELKMLAEGANFLNKELGSGIGKRLLPINLKNYSHTKSQNTEFLISKLKGSHYWKYLKSPITVYSNSSLQNNTLVSIIRENRNKYTAKLLKSNEGSKSLRCGSQEGENNLIKNMKSSQSCRNIIENKEIYENKNIYTNKKVIQDIEAENGSKLGTDLKDINNPKERDFHNSEMEY